MKIWCMIFLAVTSNTKSDGQALDYASGIPVLQAVPYSSAFTHAFSSAANAAVLQAPGWHMGIYAERIYMMEGLSAIQAAITYGGKHSSAGVHFYHSGNIDFAENQAALHFTRSLGNINIGILFRYDLFSVRGYPSDAHIISGLATTWKLSDKLYTSVQVIHPPFLRLSRGRANEEAAEYHVGFGFEASDQVYFGCETIKREGYPLLIISFIDYHLSVKYQVKAGWSSSGPQPFLSLSWSTPAFRMGIAVSVHPVLGSTPAAFFEHDTKTQPTL